MFLEIVTPEAILFSSEVTSVAVPGITGEFQMLNDHAPIVSILSNGTVKIQANENSVEEKYADKFSKSSDGRLTFEINSGTLEMKDNKVIILAD